MRFKLSKDHYWNEWPMRLKKKDRPSLATLDQWSECSSIGWQMPRKCVCHSTTASLTQSLSSEKHHFHSFEQPHSKEPFKKKPFISHVVLYKSVCSSLQSLSLSVYIIFLYISSSSLSLFLSYSFFLYFYLTLSFYISFSLILPYSLSLFLSYSFFLYFYLTISISLSLSSILVVCSKLYFELGTECPKENCSCFDDYRLPFFFFFFFTQGSKAALLKISPFNWTKLSWFDRWLYQLTVLSYRRDPDYLNSKRAWPFHG